MTDQSSEDTTSHSLPPEHPSQKPTGGHPIVALLGGIVGLWLILWVVLPNPKDQPVDPKSGVTERTPGMTAGAPNVPHVTSRPSAVLPEFNAAAILVPPDTTDEQVIHLLQRFKRARIDETLLQYVPATSKGDKLGPHAIADIYIFSEKEWSTPDALKALAKGPHGSSERDTKGSPTFQEVVPHIRGHYVINLHEAEHRDRGSLGYADENGDTHTPDYKELF